MMCLMEIRHEACQISNIILPTLQLMEHPPKETERDFAGTPYVPVYVMLPVSALTLLFVVVQGFLCF